MLVGGLTLLMGSLELLDHLPVKRVAGLLLDGVLKFLLGVFERLLGLVIVFFEKELKVQRVTLRTLNIIWNAVRFQVIFYDYFIRIL